MDKYYKALIEILPEEISVEGIRNPEFEGEFSNEVLVDGFPLDPKISLAISNHSPDGFNWGYGGSGPAQTALAILLVFMPIRMAIELYQRFKFSVVASFPKRGDFKQQVKLRDIITRIVNDPA